MGQLSEGPTTREQKSPITVQTSSNASYESVHTMQNIRGGMGLAKN